MAFHLISSNKVELLMQQLAALLAEHPLSDPFEAEVILVPSMPMKRWLGLQQAQFSGIDCNTEYPLPAAWLWNQVSSSLSDAPRLDPLARDLATWKIFDLLPSLLTRPLFVSLQQYLQNDVQGIKRWQLCERIADVFDRYQYYRPETIRSWSMGGGDDWQAELWRALLTQTGKHNHRVAVIDTFMQALKQGEVDDLPERISIFAVSSLPPLLLQVIQAVALQSDVYLYYLTPTNSYWADLKSDKAMARQRLLAPDDAVYFETGHGLLASWGRQGQVFQDLLLSDDGLQAMEFELYSDDWSPTLLGELQSDLFHVQMPEHTLTENDASVQLHVCHSALRECQVLHDALLSRMQDDKTLKPEDILVMVPEISRYAPYIEAVFSKSAARPFIPWNLSDISVADEHPVIGAFLQLLHLPSSRFSISEVLCFLDVPEICACFDLDADKLATVRTLLDKLHVRWGIDGAHKTGFDLPDTTANSWKQAEQRMLAGFAMGEGTLWHGIASYAIDHGEVSAMADFWSLFDRLNHWRKALAADDERTAPQWQSLLINMLDSLFLDSADTMGRLQLIRDALADLATQAEQSAMTLELIRHWLGDQLAERDTPGRYFSGGVSFCGMRPMRSLPFRVICLLGMHDAAFPARERPLEFDRMVQQWCPGDPGKGEMDRYLMLETLLCARDALHISYTGRSIRDNSECQPSVLVRELLDQLTRQYGKVVEEKITRVHPMQAFSPQNYLQHRAYDSYWCELANAMASDQHSDDPRDWPTEPLHATDDECQSMDIRRLVRFVVHPVKFFFNNTLSLYIHEKDDSSDEEPFALDGLENWQIKKRLLDDFLTEGASNAEQIKAEGMLPHAGFADLALATQQALVAPMLGGLQAYRQLKAEPQLIDLSCPVAGGRKVQLTGQLGRYFPGKGLLHVTPSKLAGKQMMPLWIEHLALCASGLLQGDETSLLICSDDLVTLDRLPQQEAEALLSTCIEACLQGMQYPLPLFQRASWALVNKKNVQAAWAGNSFQGIGGDRDDPYIQMIMRGVTTNPIEQPYFSEWAEQFYLPALAARRAS
ncbi:MAG: exodeoxyribonuclease V subunit gamma [Zetaproteobacteria bacterium CG12_big_fil_rev_8_21_14_0_65_54_13]|nr:MAG: exodeoxyribonuclease V subunit gamma [Zetaproteobacteria bacterium CG12_big_fil_rev_8_21_14_0_65_54_13]PIX53701.1 MAG: exodeoxyribonuclease V subunit gamma [Zetaproteobacteria bacterium CG_4_10_14_3_um_filter_54_28]PJA29395.1 MAG: exodeoxyribonuclease V subunit gamma [Zetaproteobacteria bacterium CG_4_9_14_3_um_filter_54_145]